MSTIRILSDLHYLEGSCRVHNIAQLRPLLDGADELIFNGDLIDTQHVDPTHDHTNELKAFFAAHAPTVFITGNHDPDISQIHELSLAADSIWITHGDILFEDMTPWSRYRATIRLRIEQAFATLSTKERRDLKSRLSAFREACHGLPREHGLTDRSLTTLMKRYWFVLFPPKNAYAMLHSWITLPKRAAQLVAEHRPKTRFAINGHTHLAGVWQVGPHTIVINTGSFCGPLNGQAVDIVGNQLEIRPITFRKGEFRLGVPAKTFTLPTAVSSVLSPTT